MLLAQAGRYSYSQPVNPAEFWMFALVLLAVGVAIMVASRMSQVESSPLHRVVEWVGLAVTTVGVILSVVWMLVR